MPKSNAKCNEDVSFETDDLDFLKLNTNFQRGKLDIDRSFHLNDDNLKESQSMKN